MGAFLFSGVFIYVQKIIDKNCGNNDHRTGTGQRRKLFMQDGCGQDRVQNGLDPVDQGRGHRAGMLRSLIKKDITQADLKDPEYQNDKNDNISYWFWTCCYRFYLYNFIFEFINNGLYN